MGRRSYYDTDEERLPEGMKRIGYDADTQVYTFRDADGSIWESAPGSRYGSLTKVSNALPTFTSSPASSSSSRPPRAGDVRDAKSGKGGEGHGDNYDDDDDDDEDADDHAPFLHPPPYSAESAVQSLSTTGDGGQPLPPSSSFADEGGAAHDRHHRPQKWQQQRRSWRHELMPLLNFFLLIGLVLVGIFWLLGGFSSSGGGGGGDGDSGKQAPASCPDGWTRAVVYRGQSCWQIAQLHKIELEELLRANEGLSCEPLVFGQTICVPQ